LNRRACLRKTGLVCLHCLRNLAFLRAAHDARQRWAGHQFWVTTHNNFLDIAVLEWCKVFGDRRAKHDWRKAVTDQELFFSSLLNHLRLTEELFAEYVVEMRTYRDKFIAHLDEENRMNIPNMVPATKSAQFLYRWLIENEDDCNAFWDTPKNPVAYFRGFMSEARLIYGAQTAA
jgi:hypothetical protein